MPGKAAVNKTDIIRIMDSLYVSVDEINLEKEQRTDAYNEKISELNDKLKTHESALNQWDVQLSVIEKRQHKPIIISLV